MLIRRAGLVQVAAGLGALLVAMASAVGLGLTKSASTSLPPGWVRVDVHGTIVSVNPRAGTVAISIPQREKSITRTVKFAAGAVAQIKSTFLEDVSELRAGDSVKVWGYSQPDGLLLAAHVLVMSRRGASSLGVSGGPSAASPAARPGLYGVVLAVSDEACTVLTDTGQVKEVLRAPTARIQGGAAPSGEIEEFDIVRVDGNVLSDGNFSATRIVVEFTASGARRLNGRVTAIVPEASLFVLDDTVFINMLPTTFVVQGTVLRTAGDVIVGRTVQIIGPTGATPVVAKARIVTLSN